MRRRGSLPRFRRLHTNVALEALNQGLSERAGTPKPVDTAFFANAGKAQAEMHGRHGVTYAPVTGALRTYVAARWRGMRNRNRYVPALPCGLTSPAWKSI